MKKSCFLAASLLALAACNQADKNHYTVTAQLGEQAEGLTAYILNFDNEDKIDSAVVTNGVAEFNGVINAPVMASFVVDGRRGGVFVLEADSINIGPDGFKGGINNAKMDEYNNAIKDVIVEWNTLPDSLKEIQYETFQNRLKDMSNAFISENDGSPVAYFVFLQNASDMSLAEIDEAIAKSPSLGEYKRIQQIRTLLNNREETGEGKMFKDFEVEYDGTTYRLSDYVGKGKYVLVDFWASWCGPCIRQTAVIKDILKEYGPKGLEVLGVAVWDKPEDTLEGIKAHDLPWTNIINAQSIPTEIYGIQGIPCIILFSPDGTILSRNKQGDELKADVAKAFENKAE